VQINPRKSELLMTLLLDINTFLPYIPSTLIGLLGIIFGNLFFAYRNKSDKRLDTIKSIKSSDRIRALEMYMNEMGITVNTEGLDSNQKVEIIRDLLHAKFRRYMIAAVTLVTLSLIVAFLIWSNSGRNGDRNQVAKAELNDSINAKIDRYSTELKKRTSFISSLITKPLYIEDVRSLEVAFLGNIDYQSQWFLSNTNYYVYDDLMRKSCDELVEELNKLKSNSLDLKVRGFKDAFDLFNKLKTESFNKNKIRSDHNAVELSNEDKVVFINKILPNLIS
jgi:hypothetical protein